LVALRELPELKETPVVFMTAKVQAAEVAHYRNQGALDVIAKPFDPMTLSSTVRDIWNRHVE
jgi:DNA-binding response OmpR family regulator